MRPQCARLTLRQHLGGLGLGDGGVAVCQAANWRLGTAVLISAISTVLHVCDLCCHHGALAVVEVTAMQVL